MKKTIYQIKGMGCQNCANKIQNKVSKMPGVVNAFVSLENNQLVVEYQETLLSKEDFIKAVNDLGYELV